MIVAEAAQHAQVQGAIAEHAGGRLDGVEDGAAGGGGIAVVVGRHRGSAAYLVLNDQLIDTGRSSTLPLKATS